MTETPRSQKHEDLVDILFHSETFKQQFIDFFNALRDPRRLNLLRIALVDNQTDTDNSKQTEGRLKFKAQDEWGSLYKIDFNYQCKIHLHEAAPRPKPQPKNTLECWLTLLSQGHYLERETVASWGNEAVLDAFDELVRLSNDPEVVKEYEERLKELRS